jgi:hypothetical protein
MAIGDFDSDSDVETQETQSTIQSSNPDSESESEEDDNDLRTWASTAPRSTYNAFPFTAGFPGPIRPVLTPLECFRLFLTDAIVEKVVQETNRIMRAKVKRKRGKEIPIKLLTVDEFWVFIAVLLLLEIHGKTRLEDNWKTDIYLSTPIFGKLMGIKRWKEIAGSLHFANNETDESRVDKFWKFRAVFDQFIQAFSSEYVLGQDISIDESLVLWKGHHGLKRYIPSKADKWGFKFYALAESKTGYIHSLLVDEGKLTRFDHQNLFPDLQKPGQYVMQLIYPLLNRGHILYVDNFYTDLILFQYLYKYQTSSLGTVRKGRRLLPTDVTKATMKKNNVGDIVWRYTDKFFCFCWMDKREVRILSSFGQVGMNTVTNKPFIIHNYNLGMPGVDLADQKRHGRIVAKRRLKRWYKKIFFHMIDISLVNAHIICKNIPSFVDIPAEEFRHSVVRQIVEIYHPNALSNPVSACATFHKIVLTANPQRCGVCSKEKGQKRSKYRCELCDRNYCMPDCWNSHIINI